MHTHCLLALMDNGYRRCPNCFAEFSNAAVLEAAKLAVEQEGTTKRRIFYGAALTDANQPLRAIEALLDDDINLDTECVIARWHVEIGSAYLSACMPQMSKMHLETAVTRLQQGSPPQSLYARALVALAQTCLRLGYVCQASKTTLKAISLTKWLTGAECVAVMRVIAHICKAKGDKQQFVDAHATICEILGQEEPDPWACAKGQSELGLAEIESKRYHAFHAERREGLREYDTARGARWCVRDTLRQSREHRAASCFPVILHDIRLA